jgi:hypothetical protein
MYVQASKPRSAGRASFAKEMERRTPSWGSAHLERTGSLQPVVSQQLLVFWPCCFCACLSREPIGCGSSLEARNTSHQQKAVARFATAYRLLCFLLQTHRLESSSENTVSFLATNNRCGHAFCLCGVRFHSHRSTKSKRCCLQNPLLCACG